MILFSFFSYVWSGTEENPHVLDSNKIFISLNIFWKLEGPLQGLSGTILEYIQARVNDKRIVEMLLQPETSGDNCEHDENIDKCEEKFEAVAMVTKNSKVQLPQHLKYSIFFINVSKTAMTAHVPTLK